MEEKDATRTYGRMLDIWFFVGIILSVYGGIIAVTGVYSLFRPLSQTVLGYLHPDLWWGGIMILGGIIFLRVSHRIRQKAAPTA